MKINSPIFYRTVLAASVALASTSYAMSISTVPNPDDSNPNLGNLIADDDVAVKVPVALTPNELKNRLAMNHTAKPKQATSDAPDCHPTTATAPVVPADLVQRHTGDAPVMAAPVEVVVEPAESVIDKAVDVVSDDVEAVAPIIVADNDLMYADGTDVVAVVPVVVEEPVAVAALAATIESTANEAAEAVEPIEQADDVVSDAEKAQAPVLSAEMMASTTDQKVFFPHIRKMYATYLANKAVAGEVVSDSTNVELTLDQRTERVTVKTPAAEPESAGLKGFFQGALAAVGIKSSTDEPAAVVEQFEITDATGAVGTMSSPDTAELKPIVREDSRDWFLSHREPMAQQIQEWAQEAGWKLVWTLPEVSVGEASVIYRGSFDQALEMVLTTLYPDNMPVRFSMRDSTKTAEVIHVKTHQQEQ